MQDRDAILVLTGGGGLVAAVTVAAKGLGRGIQVFRVHTLKIAP